MLHDLPPPRPHYLSKLRLHFSPPWVLSQALSAACCSFSHPRILAVACSFPSHALSSDIYRVPSVIAFSCHLPTGLSLTPPSPLMMCSLFPFPFFCLFPPWYLLKLFFFYWNTDTDFCLCVFISVSHCQEWRLAQSRKTVNVEWMLKHWKKSRKERRQ